MKTITLNLTKEEISFNGTYKNDWGTVKEFDCFKVSYTKGKRVYITVIKDDMKLSTIAKQMKFLDGSVIVSFGKNKVEIGTYTEE